MTAPSSCRSSAIALYIHVPFCETKCNYCDFNTYARLESLIPGYVEALGVELAAWGEALGRPPVRTLFLGGGTPSWLPIETFARVLDAARRSFPFAPDAEITAEANPGDVTLDRARTWAELGVNRVSMGVQSFHDGLLRLLTRRHSAAQAVEAYRTLRQAGLENVNLDLIYGLPAQSIDTWRASLERALELRPAHLSLYALTLEEGTPLAQEVQRGRAPRPDPDLAADMYELAEDLLGAAGYRHYEISNWALPGRECRHNLVYWRNEPFLGVGPGGHSYLGGARFWNIRSPAEYVRRLTAPDHPRPWTAEAIPVVEERRVLSDAERLSETLILALRLDEGLAVDEAVRAQGRDALQPHVDALRSFVPLGLVAEEDGRLRLTRRGRLLSNEVFVRLVRP